VNPVTTHFLKDILRQPQELQRTIESLSTDGEGKESLDAAVAAIRGARHVYLTGIGSSWHAALNASTFFYAEAHPVYVQDAAELLNYATIPQGPPGPTGSALFGRRQPPGGSAQSGAGPRRHVFEKSSATSAHNS